MPDVNKDVGLQVLMCVTKKKIERKGKAVLIT